MSSGVRRRPLAEEGDDTGTDTSDEASGAAAPRTCLVVRLPDAVHHDALRWLVDKIRGKRTDGGAELIVRQQPSRRHGEDLVLHISASKIKLLEAAEQLELQKRDRDGRIRDFTVGQLEEFLPADGTVDDLLTVAERQTIVRHELDNVRALPHETHIPGYSSYSLYEGQSILQVCLQKNIITQIYPLHDKEELKKLGRSWYRSLLQKQPIEAIRLYFGEGIALYFKFLGFYTTALLIPMCLGFIQLLVSTETVPFFCVFNVLWVTVFLEVWKRTSNELAFNWGTIGMTSLDEPRPNYHGEMGKDPVSGKIQPQYPRWKTNAKMYFVSFPIVFICMAVAFVIMLASFWCEDLVKNYESEYSDLLLQLPSIVYTIIVYLINLQYRTFATFLTEWENHRTQSQYERHRVIKLVLFEFVNNFMSLFYIAFVIQDMEMLRHQLAVMLIFLQAINNFQEAILPLIIRIYLEKISNLKQRLFGRRNADASDMKVMASRRKSLFSGGSKGHGVVAPLSGIAVLNTAEPLDAEQADAADDEGDTERYEGTFDDYHEMFVQFGYVVLFSSVYPIAAFWAVLNNVVEIRADAFKLCRVCQRPPARRVKDIGAWQRAFEAVGALSILTNCGLLALSPKMQARFGYLEAGAAARDGAWVLGFVALEHALLWVRFILHKAIPDRPEWVRVEMARRMHLSRRALRNERNQKTRHYLTRRFKTVHGPHQKSSS